MKQLTTLLLALVVAATASAQSDSCKTALAAVNSSYDEQLKALDSYTRINAIDREYRSLMLGFYRSDRLFKIAEGCAKGIGDYRSCLAQADAINRTYNQQLTALRGRRMDNQARMQRSDAINEERNTKLRELKASCNSGR
ncbi:MAG: hypothetical protein EOO15_13870 [Chitinophagaceae bacterium]|nr:MAG: hypothetical protein EOO15_13870 [Chitinophagaceae bacterium]